MIKIFKKTHHSSVFDLNETTGQVEETTATPLSPSAAFNLDPTEGDASYDKDSANPIVFYIDSEGYLVTESNVRAVAKKLQYSGTFMQIPVLSITVSSPAPIQWEIGDYILWDYDNQVYTLKNIPQVRKQARVNSYGEAFVYENMQFVSVLSDLKTLEFLDVVLESPSTGNYTTLPTFSFFGDCYALIDRINANLGRLYANWEVLGADVESGDIYDALHTERNVVISAPMKVWEALGLFYSMWGLGFVYSFNSTTNKHNITIGATGGETGNFAYGQGNGLRMISQSIAKEDDIVTRLRAYGSTRNMPSRYYNNKVILIDRQLFTDPMVYLPNLMIPYWKWAYTNGDPKDAYINCNNVDVDATDTSYAKYGIREASVFFDGTNGLPDIYPTIERITAKEIRDGIAALQYESEEYPLYHSPSVAIYTDAERMDLVKLGDTLTDNGVVITTEIYTQTATFAGDTANYPTTIESFTLSFDPIYSKTLAKEGEFKATLNSQEVVLSGVDTTIDSAKLKMWLTKNGSRSRLVTTIEGSPVGGVFTFILPDFTFATQEEGDTYAVEVDIDITIPPIGELGIANVNYAFEAGSLTYELTKITPITTFAINVKQIGFDIKRFLPNAGQSPVISMTSGACQGREFIIKDTRYNSATDDWTLTCARQSDTSLSNQWFPNTNFHISSGDSFVVLNINMPEFFINIAEERLYIAACDWLRKRKEPKWVFEPKVDAVYMAYNPQLIKEGMMMPLSDADLGLADSKLINTVTITENEQSIRTFDVVLRDDADKDLLKYINEAAKRESSSAVGSITNADTSKTESAEKQSVVVTSSSGTAPIELSNASTSATPNTLVLRTADADVNVRDINASRKVKGATLILPQSAPTLSSGEAAIYSLDSGFSGELPSGAGSVTSISMVVPTGLSVTPETINESGTFTISYDSGYSIPTNTKQSEWNSAYDHSQITSGNPHGTTAAQVGAFYRNNLGGQIDANSIVDGIYSEYRWLNIPDDYIASLRSVVYSDDWVSQEYTSIRAIPRKFIRSRHDGTTWGDWFEFWHSGNSGSTSFDWSAAKLTSTTLILPQTTPSLATGEMAIYGLESGFSGETPSGAGSVTSIGLTMPTGFSVSGSPITESGTFGVTFASGYFLPTTTQFASKLDVSLKGSANGLAELDENGFVKNTQLPSYVDDVIEVDNFASLPATGETGKIYVTKDDNKTWRWGGSIYVQMYAGIALGETSSTAYRGDRGKIAYDHSQSTGNPHGTTAADVGAATTIHTHTSSAPANDLVASIPNYSGYSFITEASAIGKYNAYSVITTFGQDAGRGFQLMHTAYSNDYYLRDTYNETSAANFYTLWHSGNSNLNSINWSAAKLTSTTLLIPQTTPSLTTGEMAIYGLESGFSGETPSGAGSVTSISMIVPTGLSVSPENITESGTFTISYASGYRMFTETEINGKQSKLIGTGASSLVRVNTLGVITYDDNTYLTGNQSITLSGIITGSGTTAITTEIADNALSIAKTNGLQSALDAKMTTASYPDLVAIEALTGTSGFLKKTTANTWDLDTNTYLTTTSASITYLPLIGGEASGNIHHNYDYARTIYGNLGTDGDVHIGSSGSAAALSVDYGFYTAYNAYRHTDGKWYQSRGSVGSWVFKGGLHNDGFSWLTAAASGASELAFTELMKLSTNGDLLLTAALSGVTTISASGIVSLTNTTQSTAYTNGGLVLSGGLGLAKDLFSNGKGVFASSVQMLENINTNLRIPKVAPTSPTSGQYYFYIVE